MPKVDPATPAWVLDVAEEVMRYRTDRLLQVMLDRDHLRECRARPR
jgi:hypothetical protein